MAKKATKKKAAPARPQLGDNVEILSAVRSSKAPLPIRWKQTTCLTP